MHAPSHTGDDEWDKLVDSYQMSTGRGGQASIADASVGGGLSSGTSVVQHLAAQHDRLSNSRTTISANGTSARIASQPGSRVGSRRNSLVAVAEDGEMLTPSAVPPHLLTALQQKVDKLSIDAAAPTHYSAPPSTVYTSPPPARPVQPATQTNAGQQNGTGNSLAARRSRHSFQQQSPPPESMTTPERARHAGSQRSAIDLLAIDTRRGSSNNHLAPFHSSDTPASSGEAMMSASSGSHRRNISTTSMPSLHNRNSSKYSFIAEEESSLMRDHEEEKSEKLAELSVSGIGNGIASGINSRRTSLRNSLDVKRRTGTSAIISPQQWQEFVNPQTQQRLWIHTETQMIRYDEPADEPEGSMLPPLSRQNSNITDPTALLSPTAVFNSKRNSHILTSAWASAASDQSNGNDDSDALQPANESEEDAALSELTDNANGNPTVRKTMTLDRMVKTMQHIEHQMFTMNDACQRICPTVMEDMNIIRVRIESVLHELERQSNVDKRTDVEALTETGEKFQWNLSNQHVDIYRATARTVDHSQYAFNQWHVPQYVSNTPLPTTNQPIVWALIQLPHLPTVQPTPSQSHSHHTLITQTRLPIAADSTASMLIAEALKKLQKQYGQALLALDEYVLKVIGQADYLYGNGTLMYNYEYVRQCIRHSSEVALVLMKRPATPVALPTEVELPQQYEQKVDQSIVPLTTQSYYNLNITPQHPWSSIDCIPLHCVKQSFRSTINSIESLSYTSLPRLVNVTHLYVRMYLFYGDTVISDTQRDTEALQLSNDTTDLLYQHRIHLHSVHYHRLPRSTRIAYILYGKHTIDTTQPREIALAYAVQQLIDDRGHLLSGPHSLRLWSLHTHKQTALNKRYQREPDFDMICRASTRDNHATTMTPAILHVSYHTWSKPVVAPLLDNPQHYSAISKDTAELQLKQLKKPEQQRLETLLNADLLYTLEPEDKILLWSIRSLLVQHPHMLHKFLQCVDWCNPLHRIDTWRLLQLWNRPPSPVHAIQLLDCRFSEHSVRAYAVSLLYSLTDEQVRLYLLQLVQCLKYESYHSSPLSRWLIERSIRSPLQVGHYVYWYCKVEMNLQLQYCERYYLIIEELLSYCPRLAHELRKQQILVQRLHRVSELVIRLKREHQYSDTDATKEYIRELEKINSEVFHTYGKIQIPLNPRVEVTSLMTDKCRYMSSKMIPLWLVFENVDSEEHAGQPHSATHQHHQTDATQHVVIPPVFLIFKTGDDLRQDILTLQLLTIMDQLWLQSGLDLRLTPYRVLATGVSDNGDGIGLIEVVTRSDTTSGIQLKYGGGAMGALKDDPIQLFLKDHNKGDQLVTAISNFVRSCAGYCVATFVLGVGDRHNGNIMVTMDGHLFHIDFGHILGNFKKKFGVNRERAAFVFTPEMAYVMGGKNYAKSSEFKSFLDLSQRSFDILRQHARLLEQLFILMLPANMPELCHERDIYYMRDKLYLEYSEKKAAKRFQQEIQKSLNTTYRRIDNWIHNIRHASAT